MVIEREREIRGLAERLREANERHDRSIASLDAVTARLEEMQAQARGQATRIRMKALREAVEVGRRVQELTEAQAADAAGFSVGPRSSGDRAPPSGGGSAGSNPAGGTQVRPLSKQVDRYMSVRVVSSLASWPVPVSGARLRRLPAARCA